MAKKNTPLPQSISKAFDQAVQRHQTGDFESAEKTYRQVLKIDPKNAAANNFLGILMGQKGDFRKATKLFQNSIKTNPQNPTTHKNLGNAFKELGHLKKSISSYQKAIFLKSDYTDAYHDLGIIYFALGQTTDAINSFQRTLTLNPNHANAHFNLGITFNALGQLEKACQHYQKSLTLRPDNIQAQLNLGEAFYERGLYSEALLHFEYAIALNPDLHDAFYNLGMTHTALNQLELAKKNYQKAISLKPDYTEAYNNLGMICHSLNRFDEAIIFYKKALSINPKHAKTHYNLAGSFMDIGHSLDAITHYKRALEIHPDFMDAHTNLLNALNYSADYTLEDKVAEAFKFGNLATKLAKKQAFTFNFNEINQLHIGLISGDLRSHPVGYFLEGMLEFFNYKKIKLTAYTTQPQSDALTTRIKPYFSAWKPIYNLADREAVNLIHDDGIHILIDLSGHTAHNRLPIFAWKPAPIQLSWLGYCATTGLKEIDYIIGDNNVIPLGKENNFSEKVWRLPKTYLCFNRPAFENNTSSLPAQKNGHITFGCFNNLKKINTHVIEIWAKILLSIPNSRLFLKASQLNSPTVQKNTLQQFSAHGIDSQRITLEGFESQEQYFAAYHQVDIALDPFPYPGTTSTIDALWMGVPVLTKCGNSFLSRQGLGILMHAGLPDWISKDEEMYITKAISFASNFDQLASLRRILRQQIIDSPLFDTSNFIMSFEDALWKMWLQWEKTPKD